VSEFLRAIKGGHLNLNNNKKTLIITMEPTETSLMMGHNELSLNSESFVPNFIRNQADEDQSLDIGR
jgi:hypothetical protein